MPYKVFSDSGEWCVHTLNADGSKGKRVQGGCHPTQKEADQHAAALYANVPDATKSADLAWALNLIESIKPRLIDAVKVGARNSQADQTMLQTIHDTSAVMGAQHKKKKADQAAVGDAAAKHLIGDMVGQLQGLHDTSVELGATCDYSGDMPSAEDRSQEAKAKGVPSYRSVNVKSMQDAPGLREKWARRCENCQFYQKLVEDGESDAGDGMTGMMKCHDGEWDEGEDHSGYGCVQYDFQPDPLWVCDTWAEMTPMPIDQSPIPVVVVTGSAGLAASGKAVGYLNPDDVKLDNEKEIRAAWAHVNHPSSADKYSAADKKKLEDKIVAAWKKVIDPAGPPSATAGKFFDADDADRFAVKFLDDDHIRYYAVLFGDPAHPDLSRNRDFFDAKTNFWLEHFQAPKPLTYHHGFDAKTSRDPVIGTIFEEGVDEWGVWQKAELRKARQYEDYVAKMMSAVKTNIQARVLKPSSDSIPQYVHRTPQPNGTNWVDAWPLAACTLTPTPAEPRMKPAEELKAAYKSIGRDFVMPEAPGAERWAGQSQTNRGAAGEAKTAGRTANSTITANSGGEIMPTEAELKSLYEKWDAEKKQAADAAAAAKSADEARIKAEVDRQVNEKLAAAAKSRRPALFADSGDDEAHDVHVQTIYDGMKTEDLALLATIRADAKHIGRSMGPDELLLRTLAVKSFKEIEQGKLEAKAMGDAEFKANEVMQTTLSNYGADWAVTNYSSQLWLKVRAKSRLFGSGFIPEQEIPKGFKSDTIPLEGTDITFYNVAQAANDDATMKFPAATIPSSREGTGSRELTVGKLGARGELAGELDEDSIIDAIPEFRAKLERQLGPELDFVLLNGDDTAATDNINGNGTPVATADYTTMKGIIRNALKNGSGANASDAQHALTSGKIRTLYTLMADSDGVNYVVDDPASCRVFCDQTYTWFALQGLSDLLTVSNAGPNWATIVQGADPDKGVPVHSVIWHPTSGVKPALATGVRYNAGNSVDASNDVFGRAVLVRGDQWKIRWKRRAKFETSRYARADMTEVVVTLRMGIGYYSTEASAILYDI